MSVPIPSAAQVPIEEQRQFEVIGAKYVTFVDWMMRTTGCQASDIPSLAVVWQTLRGKDVELQTAAMLGPVAIRNLLRKHASSPVFSMLGGAELIEKLLLLLAEPGHEADLRRFNEFLMYFGGGYRKDL